MVNEIKIETSNIKFIGRSINIRNLRDAILNIGLGENDTLVLNSRNFDDIVLEFRKTYGDNLKLPYLIIGVLIKEDTSGSVPLNRIGFVLNDFDSIRSDDDFIISYEDIELVYRCGWCGNITDDEGREIVGIQRARMIKYLEKSHYPIVKKIDGKCCPNGHD
ncbi:MAG: hypothetical protein JXR07_11975 [Reichenbachiella sp.]